MRVRSKQSKFAVCFTICGLGLGITLSVVPSAFAVAFGGGGGGDGCGGCIVIPPELQDRAALLEQSFAATGQGDLARQEWAEELCFNHPCAGEVSEEQAANLLRSFFARQQRAEDLARADRDRMVSWAAAVIAGLSLTVSIITAIYSARNRANSPLN